MQLPMTGGCLCGDLRYECISTALATGNCHCRDCQKARGGPFSPGIALPADALKMTKGSPKFYCSKADDGTVVHRAFCPECGSHIYAFNEATQEYIGLMAMTLDDPSWFRPMIDIWTSSAQPWVLLDPETKKYSQDYVE